MPRGRRSQGAAGLPETSWGRENEAGSWGRGRSACAGELGSRCGSQGSEMLSSSLLASQLLSSRAAIGCACLLSERLSLSTLR